MDVLEIIETLQTPGRYLKLYPSAVAPVGQWNLGTDLTGILEALMKRWQKIALTWETDENGAQYVRIVAQGR